MNTDTFGKQALKLYKKGKFSLKKESDLGFCYYPGILSVCEKLRKKPELVKTVAFISTQPQSYFPLLRAKSNIVAELTGITAIPLLLRYEHPSNLPLLVRSLFGNFSVVFCDNFRYHERAVLEPERQNFQKPIFFQEELFAGAILASLSPVQKLLRKTASKLSLVLEGHGRVLKELIVRLKEQKYLHITLLDERGAVYPKRPNLNAEKIGLIQGLGVSKDARTRKEILESADVYITTMPGDITSALTSMLPEKAVIIAMNALHVAVVKKQSLISTLPHLPNHLTDLHLAAGIAEAVVHGKSLTGESLHQAIKGLEKLGKPNPKKLFPGLLEKKLAEKIAKAIK